MTLHVLAFVALLNHLAIQDRPAEASGSLASEVPGYLLVHEKLGTGGQPGNGAFPLLRAHGFQAVINLRTANEGVDLEAEEKGVAESGMKYYGIPVGSNPSWEQAQEFMKVMKGLQGEKVFVHCASGNRVGAFLMIHRVLQDGITQAEAEAEAARIGLTSPTLRKFALQMLEEHAKRP